jgi:hypothetical protein
VGGVAAFILVLTAVLAAMGAGIIGLAAATRERSDLPTAAGAATPRSTAQPTVKLAQPPAAPTATAAPRPDATATAAPPTGTSPASTVAAVPTAPQPTPMPSQAAGEAAAASLGPADAIRLHYRLIDERRYDEGYQLMSARLRAQHSPAAYQGWFANKVSLRTVSVEIVSQEGGRAVVESVVDTTDRVGGRVVEQRVAERFDMLLEDGRWRIDRVTRL